MTPTGTGRLQISITISGSGRLFGDDLGRILGVRAGARPRSRATGASTSRRRWSPGKQLAAVGVTTVALALGRGIRRYDDVPPFLAELGAAARELG